jgi:hypothetical protein
MVRTESTRLARLRHEPGFDLAVADVDTGTTTCGEFLGIQKGGQRMLSMIKVYLPFALLSAAAPVEAQVCGTLTDAANHLAVHRSIFEDPEWADARSAHGITAIDPSDPVELVTSTAACSALIAKEVNALGLPGNPNADSYAIYRYGDYYAIEYRPIPNQSGDTIRYHGSARLRVYTVGQGQKLKGTIRVNE